jgi:hypothetical protein
LKDSSSVANGPKIRHQNTKRAEKNLVGRKTERPDLSKKGRKGANLFKCFFHKTLRFIGKNLLLSKHNMCRKKIRWGWKTERPNFSQIYIKMAEKGPIFLNVFFSLKTLRFIEKIYYYMYRESLKKRQKH